MKIFHTLLLCICAISAYAQIGRQNNTDGTYVFQKATLTTYNYDTKAEINNSIINDAALIDTTQIFLEDIFLEANISDGVLKYCTLPNQKQYKVEDELVLVPNQYKKSDRQNYHRGNSRHLSPYSTSFKDNDLTIIFLYLYGDSRYKFPLEGKLTIILTKQK